MLFAVVACAVAGCVGKDAVAPIEVEKQAFEDLRTEIRGAIDDPAREAEAIAVLDALVDDLASLRERIAERRQRTRQLNADYDALRADFEALFDQTDGEIRSSQQRVTEKHRALLAITTPEEWSAIAKARTRAMSAAGKSIKAI
jgi:chromosome segregation ATPase